MRFVSIRWSWRPAGGSAIGRLSVGAGLVRGPSFSRSAVVSSIAWPISRNTRHHWFGLAPRTKAPVRPSTGCSESRMNRTRSHSFTGTPSEPASALMQSAPQLPAVAARIRAQPGSESPSAYPVLPIASFSISQPGLRCDTAIRSTSAAFLGGRDGGEQDWPDPIGWSGFNLSS